MGEAIPEFSKYLSFSFHNLFSEKLRLLLEILIYLQRTLIRSCMRNTRGNFWKIVEFTVTVDCCRMGRMLEISFAINNVVLQV
jgi:hypothetical protein